MNHHYSYDNGFNHFEKHTQKKLDQFLRFHAVIIGITTDIQTI